MSALNNGISIYYKMFEDRKSYNRTKKKPLWDSRKPFWDKKYKKRNEQDRKRSCILSLKTFGSNCIEKQQFYKYLFKWGWGGGGSFRMGWGVLGCKSLRT